jgi:hypothetical protein
MPLLHATAACHCCMSMLHATVAWPSSYTNFLDRTCSNWSASQAGVQVLPSRPACLHISTQGSQGMEVPLLLLQMNACRSSST